MQPKGEVAGNPENTGEVYLLQRDSAAGGKRQGRYVLGELLGRGGMAEVFAGQSMGSHGFQKPVAIKRLLPELANDTVFVERLIGEAKLLVGMQHGNIVSVLDLARDGDDVFLVMEFMDGPSVRQLLKARARPTQTSPWTPPCTNIVDGSPLGGRPTWRARVCSHLK